MGWKEELKLRDFEDAERIDITCKECGYSWHEKPDTLMKANNLDNQLYIDEVEARLVCKCWGCGGKVRIALPNQFNSEGFVGGLA